MPELSDPALTGPLQTFFAAGLEDGLANYVALVEGLPAYLGRLPEAWREVAYEWIWIWVEPSVPPAEAALVLEALAPLRELLERDSELRPAQRLLARLPAEEGGMAASPEQRERAAYLVGEIAREKGFDAYSVDSILSHAKQLEELPFAALVPSLSELLEAVRQLWYAQGLPELNDALLALLDRAPSAEELAAVLRDEVAAIDEVVRGYVVEFLADLHRGSPMLGPGSTAKQGLARVLG